MSNDLPELRWLPLSHAVKRISKRLGVSTEVARRALFDALKDDVTRARGLFWDMRNDRTYLKEICSQILLNSDIDWDNDVISFNEPMRFPPGYDTLFCGVEKVGVYRDNLDEWLKAHCNREPSKSHDKGTDVVCEKAVATKSTPSRRRKGGPRRKPYLRHLHKFLDGRLDKDGPGYFTRGIGAIASDVRWRFNIDDPENKLGLPKSRSGLQEPIKKWMRDNDLLE